MAKERILITVKTYPTLSSKYDETVCTAGIKEDGSWIRIYPISFRKLDEFERYKKFNWIEVNVERNLSDTRPESHKLKSSINIIGEASTKSDWRERNKIILEKGKVFRNFDEIISLNKGDQHLSLATFKPSAIIDLDIEATEREWDKNKLAAIQAKAKQDDFFQKSDEYFKVAKKLPYNFKYVFKDETGKKRSLSINDWEIGALYWNELKRKNGDEAKTIESVKNKYLKDLVQGRDIHFFVGTTYSQDNKNAPNPFTIIGVYSPPEIKQGTLF